MGIVAVSKAVMLIHRLRTADLTDPELQVRRMLWVQLLIHNVIPYLQYIDIPEGWGDNPVSVHTW